MQAYDKVFIDGRWQGAGGERVEVFEAATGEVMATVPRAGVEQIDEAVKAARRAFPTWSQTPLEKRLEYLTALHGQLKARSEDVAQSVAREVGTPIKLARSIQAGLPIAITGSYLQLLPEFPFVEKVGNSEIQQAPVGVVGAITPWNYPLHQIILKVVPALGAGCTVVLKPSEVAPLTAFILAEIFEAIGLPPGVFNLVSGRGRVIGDALINHPDVDMLSFTGSSNTGRHLFRAAADDFKRISLELGGKSASIILPDADIEAAVKGTVSNCYLNSGQTCTAHTRMLVPNSRYDEAFALAAAAA
jgi:aldehyde dehydrogenase (NAD+)